MVFAEVFSSGGMYCGKRRRGKVSHFGLGLST
jgi:hypothetical protein